MMNKLITGLLVLFLLSMPVACAGETAAPAFPAPTPSPEPAPAPTTPVPPAPIPPGGEPPGTPGAANDDIVTPPGGWTYRANVHVQGQPDWPPVHESVTALSTLSGSISIRYRDYIETKAGEIRNNIIFLDARNAPEITDALQISYRPEGLPAGITVERDRQMYGGIGGEGRKGSRVTLKINIAPQIKPGEYPFAIQLEYEGKDFGNLPCTIKVIE
jgi:hypothetical protein